MGKHCTKVEKAQRVSECVQLISSGATTSNLVRYCADKWGLGRRQAEVYIAEARKIIIADVDMDRKIVVAEMIATCKVLIRKGMQTGNYSTVLGAMNRISALCGLDQSR